MLGCVTDIAILGTHMCTKVFHTVLHAVSVCRSSDICIVITGDGVTFVLQARIL